MDAAGAAVFDEVLRGWSAADRGALADLLERLVRELDEQPLGRSSHPAEPDG
jgi:hypothetical protein